MVQSSQVAECGNRRGQCFAVSESVASALTSRGRTRLSRQRARHEIQYGGYHQRNCGEPNGILLDC